MRTIIVVLALLFIGCENDAPPKHTKTTPDTMKYDGRLYISDNDGNWNLLDSIKIKK